MEKSDYHLYRYFILKTSDQIGIYENNNKTKEELVKDVFDEIVESKKVDFIHRADRFIIYSIKTFDDDLYFFKIAKEHKSKEYLEGEDNVIEENVNRLEVVNFVCQVSTQLIAIQKDTTSFSNTSTPINAFERFLCTSMKLYNYNINIDEKTSENKFWDYVENAKRIYSVKLKLNAPNINVGGEDVREALEKLHDDFNNDEVELQLKNDDGNLNIRKSILGNFISYITTVGGKYRLVYLTSNGVKKAIDSITNIVKIKLLKNLEDEDERQISDKLKNISEKSNEENP